MKRLLVLLCTMLAFSCSEDSSSPTTSPPPPPPPPPGPPPPPPNGTWTSQAPMLMPVQETTPVVLNGKIYIVGGFDTTAAVSRSSTDLVQVYDPTSDSWSMAAPLPRPMHHIGATSMNGKLYVLGGYEGGEYSPTDYVYEFDPALNSWVEKSRLPIPRGEAVALAYEGRIYLIGGIDVVSNGSRRNDIYDPATDTWSEGAPLPTVRSHAAGAVLDSLLYIVGGQNAQGNVKTIEAYSPSTNIWHSIPAMPTGRHGAAVGALNKLLYVVGGEGGEGASFEEWLTVNEEYDPATQSWRTVTPIPTGRSHIGGAVVGNYFYVAGGSGPNGDPAHNHTIGTNEAFELK